MSLRAPAYMEEAIEEIVIASASEIQYNTFTIIVVDCFASARNDGLMFYIAGGRNDDT